MKNIVVGAGDTIAETVRTGGDLITVALTNSDNRDITQFNSKLFQAAIQTAGDPQAAADLNRQVVFGIVTLGVGPLAQSGYQAMISGDSTEFSQQAGGFGIMVLGPYGVGQVANRLPPVRLPLPQFQPGPVLQPAGGVAVQISGAFVWEWVTVGSVRIPVLVTAAASTTGAAMSMTVTGTGGGADSGLPSDGQGGDAAKPVVDGDTASPIPIPKGHTRVYRAVSEAEYQQMIESGKFEQGPNSLEGKWFWESPADAEKFGASNMGPGPGNFRVIEADVPDVTPGLYKVPKLDGIGPARYLPIEDLTGVTPRPAGGS